MDQANQKWKTHIYETQWEQLQTGKFIPTKAKKAQTNNLTLQPKEL